jgi:2-hydroxycyclohexanecarboxyl-CoA dehydrogenase
MPRLDGRVALVTGAGSGIGRAVAHRLAEEGAIVAATDLNTDAAGETVATISAAGHRASGHGLDVTDTASVAAAIEAIRSLHGPVDILVNCAGWDVMQPFVDNTPDFWAKIIDINLKGPIHCARAVLDDMIERRSGKIVSIGSDAGRVGSSGETVYAGCKGGVIAFSKSLAREVARYGINVNVVCPGPTDTPLWWGMVAGGSEKLMDALIRSIPFRRLAKPEEIAAAIAFFASPDADYVTGQVLSVSGGLTMAG